nr:protein sqs1 [Quercus suber]
MGKKKKAQGRAGQKGKAQKTKAARGNDYDDSWSDNPPSKSLGGGTPHKGFKGFAQNPPQSESSPFGSHVKLRHHNITFVSAGTNTPRTQDTDGEKDKELVQNEDDQEVMDVDTDLDDRAIQTNLTTEMGNVHIRGTQELRDTEEIQAGLKQGNDVMEADAAPSQTDTLFVIDTIGDASLAHASNNNISRPKMRFPSPTPSSSSEEVVFHGRTQRPKIVDDPPASQPSVQQKKSTRATRTPHVTDDLLAAVEAPETYHGPLSSQPTSPAPHLPPIQTPPPESTRSTYRLIKAEVPPEEPAWTPAPEYPYWRKGKIPDPDIHDPRPAAPMLSKTAPRLFVPAKGADKSAAETIASLQAEMRKVRSAKKVEKKLKSTSADFETLESPTTRPDRRGKRGRKKSNRILRAAVTNGLHDDDDDDDDSAAEAAYDDYMANLAAQLEKGDLDEHDQDAAVHLSRSAFLAGPSLVVDGKEIGEDQVLDKHFTTDEWEDATSSDHANASHDVDQMSEDEDSTSMSEEDSSDLEDALDYTLKEQWEDEEDLRQRRIERMTDEHVAQLYAKQQELGIDSDDIVIEDGTFASDAEDFGDLNAARRGFAHIASSSAGRPTKRRSRRGRGELSFPDASALADTIDQYGDAGFDIMDFDRPSLRPTKKGRKGKFPTELEAISDEEMRGNMFDAWENDREKKRVKKAAREQARADGMLGSSGKKGKADLGMKYREGMTMQQIGDELRVFLQDDGQQSRPFPPMDKKDRKSLHEMASAFNLKSKSVGSGKQRFAVLYKTSFTTEFSEHQLNRVLAAQARGFLRVSGKGRGFGGGSGNANKFRSTRGGQGGGFSAAATSLRNGEIVGANAAEIGKESFGHKLMEKMGWSKGMALGKDGEGMLLPVAQVMRSGKAGLG